MLIVGFCCFCIGLVVGLLIGWYKRRKLESEIEGAKLDGLKDFCNYLFKDGDDWLADA